MNIAKHVSKGHLLLTSAVCTFTLSNIIYDVR